MLFFVLLIFDDFFLFIVPSFTFFPFYIFFDLHCALVSHSFTVCSSDVCKGLWSALTSVTDFIYWLKSISFLCVGTSLMCMHGCMVGHITHVKTHVCVCVCFCSIFMYGCSPEDWRQTEPTKVVSCSLSHFSFESVCSFICGWRWRQFLAALDRRFNNLSIFYWTFI